MRSPLWGLFEKRFARTILICCMCKSTGAEGSTISCSELDLPVVGADHGGVSKGVVKLFKRRAFEKAALCYGQTENECRMIERFGGRSKLQPNGCDVSEFFPDPDVQRGKTVLTVTRLTNKQKRTSDLIRAMAELPEEWTLDIVGTGPDRDMLERLAADLRLSSRVRFHGFVGRAEVRDLFRRCGVYAMPSANEGLAVAALEAMACGAAVVLSQIRAFEPLVDRWHKWSPRAGRRREGLGRRNYRRMGAS